MIIKIFLVLLLSGCAGVYQPYPYEYNQYGYNQYGYSRPIYPTYRPVYYPYNYPSYGIIQPYRNYPHHHFH